MSVIFKTVKICPHCRRPLIPSNVPDYVWQCMDCDEDFYDVECRFEKLNKELFVSRSKDNVTGKQMYDIAFQYYEGGNKDGLSEKNS